MISDSAPEEVDLRQRAGALVEQLAEDGTPIGLPAVVVAEFLCIVPEDQQRAMLQVLAKKFMLLPLDGPAAVTYATLFRERQAELSAAKAQKSATEPTRAKMKADFLIVATCVQARATKIYSHDPDLKRFARGRITVLELPPRPAVQLSLPNVAD